MALSKKYHPQTVEPRLQARWQASGMYHFDPHSQRPVYSIDTPPPTVSGHLHLGHVYSYTHPDLVARYHRMQGDNVYYPMGFDDNGLPTERLVERLEQITATEVGRQEFIRRCLQASTEAEKDYQQLWQRLGLSIDWRFTYRTIAPPARRMAQHSFIDLYQRGLIYRQEAPAIWCPECQTAIAQAELNDLEQTTEFITIPFELENGDTLPIATTRPELLPACVAVFIHPDDQRYQSLLGENVRVPIFGQVVPILTDALADPEKGTGAVMCCTFGDAIDVAWWRTHQLPLVEALGKDGKMLAPAGPLEGMEVTEARQAIRAALSEQGLVLARQPTVHEVRVHERCDTPVEYVVTKQWFVRVLDFKAELLQAGEKVRWHPRHMQARYRAWVENLGWDWCISRQRFYGVPFPVWYCQDCGEPVMAAFEELPVDPIEQIPANPCKCGGSEFIPDRDVMDTWATSSLSPQIVGRWLTDQRDGLSAYAEINTEELYQQVYPYSLRPQAHEIIRTWAFYTIVKSLYHFDSLPWTDVLISGWGIAGEGLGKISKSRGGGPMPPLEMIENYSADAVRYWAASTGPGKDAIISEEKIRLGGKLLTKLWNVARFSERFIISGQPAGLTASAVPLPAQRLNPADRWIIARLQQLIQRVTNLLDEFDYATAKSEIEVFFWQDFCDNYLEMIKQRLYAEEHPTHQAARNSLAYVFLNVLKMLAPFLSHITEEIYLALFAGPDEAGEDEASIHTAQWPAYLAEYDQPAWLNAGELLVVIASAVRRYKSEHNLSLATELARLAIYLPPSQGAAGEGLRENGAQAASDLASITRAREILFVDRLEPSWERLPADGPVELAIQTLPAEETQKR